MFPQNDEKTWFILTSVEIAILGGISNWLMSKEHKWFQLLVNIFTAGFVGLLVGELCLHHEFAVPWSYFIAGASGVAAETILLVFKQCVILRLELLLNKDISTELKSSVYSTQLGDLLQERFGVSEKDIEKALNAQNIGKMKIGEILVDQGIITQETLDEALKIQEERKKKAKAKKTAKEKSENAFDVE